MDQNLQPYDLGVGVKEASCGMRATKTGHGGKCNQCDYTSTYASKLREHMKTHSDEMSNKCSLCDYASPDPSALRTHLKKHSGAIKNFSKNLKMHSGEKSN